MVKDTVVEPITQIIYIQSIKCAFKVKGGFFAKKKWNSKTMSHDGALMIAEYELSLAIYAEHVNIKLI